jgi:hypothetical protein
MAYRPPNRSFRDSLPSKRALEAAVIADYDARDWCGNGVGIWCGYSAIFMIAVSRSHTRVTERVQT